MNEYSNQSRKRREVCVTKMHHHVMNSHELPGGDQARVALIELQTSHGTMSGFFPLFAKSSDRRFTKQVQLESL